MLNKAESITLQLSWFWSKTILLFFPQVSRVLFRYFRDSFTSVKIDIDIHNVSDFRTKIVSKVEKTESPKLNIYRIALPNRFLFDFIQVAKKV
jgi:hypothetical protein